MLIVLNHKMNLNIEEIKAYEKILRDYEVIVMPQTPYMGLFTNGKYILGSQCISEYNATGGVSAEALIGMNVKYVMVGHSERRVILRDTDEVIVKKIEDIIESGMIPIMCMGDDGTSDLETLQNQIDSVFENLSVSLDNIVVGYEPVLNIGTNNIIPTEIITKKIKFIKDYIYRKYNKELKVLYGGGINSENVHNLKDINIMDGVIVGTASLDINNVINIYNKLQS